MQRFSAEDPNVLTGASLEAYPGLGISNKKYSLLDPYQTIELEFEAILVWNMDIRVYQGKKKIRFQHDEGIN